MKPYKEHKEISIGEILDLAKDNSLQTREEQRVFKNKKKQFFDIVNSVLREKMFSSMIFCDVESSLEFAIKNNNEDDIEYFTNLLEDGIKHTIEDGQHRMKYYFLSKTLLSDRQHNELLKCKVPVYFLYNYSVDDLTEVFNTVNSGTKIKVHELVWSIVNSFNTELKNKTETLNLHLYSKSVDILQKIRSSYKFLLKGLKVCANKEGIHNVGKETGDDSLKLFVNQKYEMVLFEGVFKCFETMVSILNTREDLINKLEDYTKFNLLFTIHLIKLNNYKADINWIVNFVNGIEKIGKFDNSRALINTRYDYLKIKINESFTKK